MKPQARIAKDTAAVLAALATEAITPIIGGMPDDAPDSHRRAIISLACGLTHQSVADTLGVSRQAVTRWATQYRDTLIAVRARKRDFLNAVHEDALVLAVETGFHLLAQMQADPRATPAGDLLLIVRALEGIKRMTIPDGGDTDKQGRLRKITQADLQAARREFGSLGKLLKAREVAPESGNVGAEIVESSQNIDQNGP